MARRVTTAVCTIITLRGLAHARVLMAQIARWHPDWTRYALLIDVPAGYVDPAAEGFRIVEVRHLPLADKQATLFYYTPGDLDAAVKPWFFSYLFDTCGFDRLVFLDAKSWVEAPLSALVRELESNAPLVVVPHLLGELRDEKQPGEMDILRWGIHDGAVLAMSRSAPAAAELLAWWCRRVHRHALRRPVEGLYRDQRWLDLAAGRWNVATLRDPSYDVAYFNLSERDLTRRGSQYFVRGNPLVLFRFPDFDPDHPERLSDKDERFGDRLPDAAKALARSYADELLSAGHQSCRNLPYGFSRFANGAPVSDFARLLYQRDRQVRDDCGADPFASGPRVFNEPLGRDPMVTRLMGEIWKARPDLQRVFPEIEGRDARRFAEWFVATAGAECGIGEEHLGPVAARLRESSGATRTNGTPPDESAAWTPADGPEPRVGPLAKIRRLGARAVESRLALAASAALRSRLSSSNGLGTRVSAAVRGISAPPRPRLGPSATLAKRPPERPRAGLNICGYVTADLGVGQSARCSAVAAQAAGIDFSMIDFAIGTTSPKTDRTFADAFRSRNDHAVNLVHINADQFPVFRHAMGPAFFEGKYTIGYWHWELPEFPDEWISSFDHLDEVWVPTDFVLGAVSEKSSVPVVRIPHALSFRTVRPSRERFGLPQGKFLFLSMYDLLSYQERKNPDAAIRAFRDAFGDARDAALVIKVLNADKCPDEMSALKASLADLPGSVLIHSSLGRQDVYDLEASCDAFISLHRSEGFGLGLAECMYLGKPVVGTNWSGNVDFMTHKNSCPVNYEIVTLERDHGPYRKGQRWADPDVEHAASYMQKLVREPAFAREIGERARRTMTTTYSPLAVGERYRARLKRLKFLD